MIFPTERDIKIIVANAMQEEGAFLTYHFLVSLLNKYTRKIEELNTSTLLSTGKEGSDNGSD